MAVVGWVLIGLAILLVFRVIANPRSKQTGRGWGVMRRIGGFFGAVLMALIGLAIVVPAEEGAQADTVPSSSAELRAAISNASRAPAEPEPAPAPKHDWVEAGTPLEIGPTWLIWAGWEDQGIVFRKQLGSEYFGEIADGGYQYALVPVAVKNDTQRTESLALASWELSDEQGYEYTIETLADIYLGENNRLDVTNVPPGATRAGYLVFQVRENIEELYLSLSTVRSGGKWRFVIEN